MESADPRGPTSAEGRWALILFLAALLFSGWAVRVGGEGKRLLGFEFRQAQTALSAYWIKAEHNYSLAYPTPVLGKPWSVPMEFPLYQWTAVAVSDVTGLSLTKSGRAVSIACFYLCLPALFLLLRRWDVPVGRRWLVLALVVTCPFYLFYARGFLIETMALMFSLWFWVAYERAVERRSAAWLAVAIVAGAGGGLVKVTTFMLYLLPAAWWSVHRLWTRRKADWLRDAAWMAAAVAVPFIATLAWLHFADATKAANPLARFLTADNLRDFNFGTNADRFSAKFWLMKWRIIREELTGCPVLALAGGLALFASPARWRQLTGCVLGFGVVLVLFPILYAIHDYYYVANTALLLLAMGLAVVALAENRVPRAVVFAAMLLLLGGQVWHYRQHYYPEQAQIQPGGSGLTEALQTVTGPDDVIVVLGQDWNSMLPYYARRRALMIRETAAKDPALMAEGLAQLAGEKIGALVIDGNALGADWWVKRAPELGLTAGPVFRWHDAFVFLPAETARGYLHVLLDRAFPEVHLAPGVEQPREGLANEWREVASLRPWQRRNFQAMRPEPVRYFASFGPNADGSSGRFLYNAHPDTRLVFALPAGKHTLRSTLEMTLEAWGVESQHTTGVEVTLFALGADGSRSQLATRDFDPYHNEADRQPARPLVIEFELPAAGEVELYFGPGDQGDYTRDWIMLGPLTIE